MREIVLMLFKRHATAFEPARAVAEEDGKLARALVDANNLHDSLDAAESVVLREGGTLFEVFGPVSVADGKADISRLFYMQKYDLIYIKNLSDTVSVVSPIDTINMRNGGVVVVDAYSYKISIYA